MFHKWARQGHVSNFYIVDLENFATASRRLVGIQVISTTHPWSVRLWHLWDNESNSVASWLSAHVYRTLLPTKPPTSYHRFGPDLSYTVSSFCTVAWQLARFQLTRRIARSLGDSGASCHWYFTPVRSIGLDNSPGDISLGDSNSPGTMQWKTKHRTPF